MKAADATDVPNLIRRFSPRIAAIFDPFTFLRWFFLPHAGKTLH